MSSRRHRHLSEEERDLWHRVARTAVPLPGKVLKKPEPEPESDREGNQAQRKPVVARGAASLASASQRRQPAAPVLKDGFDRPTRRKIAKGRLAIESRIDLHGMTQGEAHAVLLGFLSRAHASGQRHVLVITGKGSSPASDGVLFRTVPSWLATAPFRGLVSGFDRAARQHGGEGAIYVRLRRAPPSRSGGSET